MRSAEEFERVQRLVAAGLNDCAIARRTGIPRRTVRDMRAKPAVARRHVAGTSACGIEHRFAEISPKPYCYLLGLYLGDGCISRAGRVWHLRITLDKKYPAIIHRCRQAIDMLMPTQRAGVVNRVGCVDVYLLSKHWPCLFPQHGPGKKHHRRIALEPWQQALVDKETEEFVMGLIHSDGCRVIANDRGVMSVRYHFSNMSEDIIGLFTAALDALDIPWTRSSKKIVSIYRKAATARLDIFIGPKTRAVPLNGVHYTA
uniref:hypothetical protein n=1 Tax=Mycolicibacterium stellerae TaxID=2358193 RepID=UPI000F0BB753